MLVGEHSLLAGGFSEEGGGRLSDGVTCTSIDGAILNLGPAVKPPHCEVMIGHIGNIN